MSINYFKKLSRILYKAEVTNKKGKTLSFDLAILKIINLINAMNKRTNKIIFIGNGGSASIASHISTDFLKNAKIPAMAFNDSSLITCISNDLGYEHVFDKPLEMLAQRNDILFSISSSGSSKSILNAAQKAGKLGCLLVTLSGFDKVNPLRKLGDINFYVPSFSYGFVEITHLAISHCIVDGIIENNKANG